MKYVAIIDSDDELSEESIEKIKDTIFVGNEDSKYCFEFTSIKQAPEPRFNPKVTENFWESAGYDRALRDCGVLEE